jgi:hypothetical protein
MDNKIEKAKSVKVILKPTAKGKKKGFPEGALNSDGNLAVNEKTASKLLAAGLAEELKK